MNQTTGNPFKPGFATRTEPVSPTKTNPDLRPMLPVESAEGQGVIADKELRRDLDTQLQKLKGLLPSRERSIAITKLQECIMWLGMDLKRLNDTRPYPSSYDPSTTKVEPTAENLKL